MHTLRIFSRIQHHTLPIVQHQAPLTEKKIGGKKFHTVELVLVCVWPCLHNKNSSLAIFPFNWMCLRMFPLLCEPDTLVVCLCVCSLTNQPDLSSHLSLSLSMCQPMLSVITGNPPWSVPMAWLPREGYHHTLQGRVPCGSPDGDSRPWLPWVPSYPQTLAPRTCPHCSSRSPGWDSPCPSKGEMTCSPYISLILICVHNDFDKNSLVSNVRASFRF